METCAQNKCKKKVFIAPECRCGKSFCIKHLLPEKHNCGYNYKIITVKEFKETKVIIHGPPEL